MVLTAARWAGQRLLLPAAWATATVRHSAPHEPACHAPCPCRRAASSSSKDGDDTAQQEPAQQQGGREADQQQRKQPSGPSSPTSPQQRQAEVAAVARSLLARFDAPASSEAGPPAPGPGTPVPSGSGPTSPDQDPAGALDMRDVVQVVLAAVENCKPSLKVKQVKEGNRVKTIPFYVHPREQRSLAVRWILAAAHKRKEGASGRTTMAECLAEEILLAAEKKGAARQKRDEMHRLAVENQANMLRRL